MQSDKMLMTTAIALALGASGLSPAYAADEASDMESRRRKRALKRSRRPGTATRSIS